jgi:hypothetical protein
MNVHGCIDKKHCTRTAPHQLDGLFHHGLMLLGAECEFKPKLLIVLLIVLRRWRRPFFAEVVIPLVPKRVVLVETYVLQIVPEILFPKEATLAKVCANLEQAQLFTCR